MRVFALISFASLAVSSALPAHRSVSPERPAISQAEWDSGYHWSLLQYEDKGCSGRPLNSAARDKISGGNASGHGMKKGCFSLMDAANYVMFEGNGTVLKLYSKPGCKSKDFETQVWPGCQEIPQPGTNAKALYYTITYEER
ncbi:hypothetical protein N7492_006583 [Penicillium capsulatum]|uniref:Uncharacterized protein n=1 Tax=Penicillium capsulatum TaxID=69766 RepID=A0A9W9LLA0_9EURO|nr:hypothetical protein N7492_006583 [Penicillium capsulatum]KAJ6116418.1 hypothetical protein N7512_006143 [Penicillium capsulatum]